MAGVYISDVDDYLAPSQACTNPLFSNDKEKTEGEVKNEESGLVVPKKRVRRSLASKQSIGARIPKDPVKASIADCLACSGCVTSSETVLLETQHGSKVLAEVLAAPLPPKMVLTMSPAAWADLSRSLGCDTFTIQDQQRWTTLLHRALSVVCVLDGNLTLEWSRRKAAEEFCEAYERRFNTNEDSMSLDIPSHEVWDAEGYPSMAVSRNRSQYQIDGTVRDVAVDDGPRSFQQLPLISGSCPATVCLVEKSTKAISNLAVTKSPLAIAGQLFGQDLYHIGVMPCHDKKLEASRKDFEDDMNIVLTTQECLDIVLERLKCSREQLQSEFASVPLALIAENPLALIAENHLSAISKASSTDTPVLLTSAAEAITSSAASEQSSLQVNTVATLGSGGYAAYIFCHAAAVLFNTPHLDPRDLPWEPVVNSSTTAKVSARVAGASKRRKDYYQLLLFPGSNGGYTMQANEAAGKPVLRFAIAYGMQTLQRVLKPFETGTEHQYDYVEAMACPSGCVNGGGQIRSSAVRETPADTRTRVEATQRLLQVPKAASTTVPAPSHVSYHTHYHIVPPLQYSQGAAAGVAVSDTQW